MKTLFLSPSVAALLLITLLLPVCASAKSTTPELQDKINAIIQPGHINDAFAMAKAEDDLAALGLTNLAGMQVILTESRNQLEQSPNRTLGEVSNIQTKIGLIDDAIIRITWKINPREIINRFLNKTEEPEQASPPFQIRPVKIDDESIHQQFPLVLFYTLTPRLYPSAVMERPPLKQHNLFVIDQKGKLTHLTDVAGLENFFRDSIKSTNSAPFSNTEPFKKNLVYAWLRLSEEFSQDGFLKFGIAPESIVVSRENEGWKALGKATVVAKGGDRGEIGVVMIFRADGSLDKISETRSARPGIRPKCQATKVLDPDSVVRAMADQDILIMGSRIEKYLLEQYSIANPELKVALKKLWERILEDEKL